MDRIFSYLNKRRSMRESLSKVEKEVMGAMVHFWAQSEPPGVAQVAGHLKRSLSGVGDAVARLIERGLIRQPFKKGALVLVRLESGAPVKLQLLIGEPGKAQVLTTYERVDPLDAKTEENLAVLQAHQARQEEPLTGEQVRRILREELGRDR